MKSLARLVALLGCLALTACGVGQGSAVTIAAGDPIKVGVLPVADFAPVYIAQDKGYFADEGLQVQTQVMQNAAAIAPSVINGQLQFGTGAVTPFIAAAQKGLPLRAVANMADTAATPATDPSAILVAGGSSLKRPRDLVNHKVAVNGLGAITHVAAAEAIAKDGGDPTSVTFVAMPFPDMIPALKQGRIDAASVVEPFLTLGTAQDATAISHPYTTAFAPGRTMAVMFSAQPFLDKNPDVAHRFVRALNRASEVAATDPEAVRQVLVTHGRMKPEIVAKIRFPGYGTSVSADAITQTATVMETLKMIPGSLDGSSVVWR